ncbi:MAG: hypothetical protein ACREQF_12910, partial [Candidatus Binataceae bacterium]
VMYARRTAIDPATWTNWAYCETTNLQMIYNLESTSAEIEVKAEPSGKNASFVSVRSDLRGTYGLGSDSTTVGCISRGVVEKEILTAAGVPPSGATN